MKHQAPLGTRDLLPAELARWQWAESQARGVLERYGYGEIRTPIFEDYELFARTSGESSDVVTKEMYRFTDLGDRDLALRPEGTASVARAYLERGLGGQARIHRLWYMGPMFRYSRPQKGRFRQFHQIGAEIIGSSAPGADVEMIALFVDLFEAWGFSNLTVAVNSVGTPGTRREYGERLREWLAPVASDLGGDSLQRLISNPLRVLDTKDPRDLELFDKLVRGGAPMPRMLDSLDSESREHWEQVLGGLDALGIAHRTDPGLVRGLDYYTRTAFEVHDPSLGAQSALGGGGRYDGLIEALGGPPTPGVGFSIGLDRTMMVLEQRAAGGPAVPGTIFVAAMEGTRAAAAQLTRELRREFRVDCDLESRAIGAQLKLADRAGATLVLLLGEEEWARGEVVIKSLRDGGQKVVPRAMLLEALRERLK
ncbi:MAG: histidine--tRNA ligase [Candidatus Eisenbacteria bacterium]|nr:histidine--tRNA ligase [Candidatus Eisenbacteria bacterium]